VDLILLYFARLYTTKLNPLLKESFLLCQNLDSQGIYTWFSYAKSIIDETGLDIINRMCSLILSFVISFLYSKLDIDK
jgi:succinate dehydrogenase flavin-adding protein (antitoxin of CptAB toxin-antitoxin module)